MAITGAKKGFLASSRDRSSNVARSPRTIRATSAPVCSMKHVSLMLSGKSSSTAASAWFTSSTTCPPACSFASRLPGNS